MRIKCCCKTTHFFQYLLSLHRIWPKFSWMTFDSFRTSSTFQLTILEMNFVSCETSRIFHWRGATATSWGIGSVAAGAGTRSFDMAVWRRFVGLSVKPSSDEYDDVASASSCGGGVGGIGSGCGCKESMALDPLGCKRKKFARQQKLKFVHFFLN